MSARGEITVECDVPGCHAEEVLSHRLLFAALIVHLLDDDGDGWLCVGRENKWVCPQCSTEGKEP